MVFARLIYSVICTAIYLFFSPRYSSRTGMPCLRPVDRRNELSGTGKSWGRQGCHVGVLVEASGVPTASTAV